MTASESQKLVDAIDRNTAATRAIAIFLLRSIPWTLGGVGLMALGFIALTTTESSEGGLLFVVLGIGVMLYGSIRTLVMALRELAYSEFIS